MRKTGTLESQNAFLRVTVVENQHNKDTGTIMRGYQRIFIAAALAALDDRGFVDRVIENNERSRSLLYPELDRLGLHYVPSHTNFLFVDLKKDARKVSEALLRLGFLVRPGTPWKLPTCVRITFGTETQNAAFIGALEKALEETGG